jgi:hypothetical protein
MRPVRPDGMTDVAEVVPLGGTGVTYPVTGTDVEPIEANAYEIVIGRSVATLPIDQCTIGEPVEQSVKPDKIA